MTYGAGYIYTSRASEITASFVGVSLFGLFSFHVIFCVLPFPFSILMKYKRSISRTYWLEHFFETLNEVWLMNSYNVISKYYYVIILLYDNLWLLIKDIRIVVANSNYTELVWKSNLERYYWPLTLNRTQNSNKATLYRSLRNIIWNYLVLISIYQVRYNVGVFIPETQS